MTAPDPTRPWSAHPLARELDVALDASTIVRTRINHSTCNTVRHTRSPSPRVAICNTFSAGRLRSG